MTNIDDQFLPPPLLVLFFINIVDAFINLPMIPRSPWRTTINLSNCQPMPLICSQFNSFDSILRSFSFILVCVHFVYRSHVIETRDTYVS